MHLVQIRIRGPLGIRAHCILGYTRRSPQGLNLVARTELEYLPTTLEPFSHNRQMFAMFLIIKVLKSLYISIIWGIKQGFTSPLCDAFAIARGGICW